MFFHCCQAFIIIDSKEDRRINEAHSSPRPVAIVEHYHFSRKARSF